jgi:cytoskeletal protein CcmA (bactofilin family)
VIVPGPCVALAAENNSPRGWTFVRRGMRQSSSMITLGKALSVKGELRVREDLTVEGRIEGPVWCEDRAVTVAPSAHVVGDIIARDITVFGRIAGQLLATDVVDVRAEATVTGRVVSKRFILNDGANFNGRAEPQHLDTAFRVAKYQQQQKNPDPGR